MSEEDNTSNGSKNSIPLPECPKDSVEVINSSGESTEGTSSGDPSTTELEQTSDALNQPESARVSKLRAKWEETANKCCAEFASALPGGSPEPGYAGQRQDNHAGDPSKAPTMQENQEKPSQTDPQQGLHGPCQESHPPAPVEHVPQEQLQGSHLEGTAHQDNFSQGQSQGYQGQQNNQQQGISQEHPLQNVPLEDPDQVTLQEGQPYPPDNVLPGDNFQGTDISNRNASGGSGRQTSQENPGAYRQSTVLQASQQCNAVVFNLYTSLDAEDVKVMTADNRTIQLYQAQHGNKHHWINRQPFHLPDDQKVFLYHYIATFKKNIVKRIFNWVSGTDPYELITEKGFQKLNTGGHQYDIFRFSANKENDQCLVDGYLSFVELLYLDLGGRNDLSQILTECEKVPLGLHWIENADRSTLSKWIEQFTSKSNTWYHAAFICSILGRMIMQLGNYTDIFHYMQSRTADRLLDLLTGCQYGLIPRSSVEMIKSVATHLLRASSQKGWLAFLSYFANLFEVDRLLKIAVTLPMLYSDECFNYLTGFVVQLLRVSLAEVSDRSKICEFVLEGCHSICCLWHLYEELSVHLPDLTNALGDTFSQRFCELISCRTRSQKIDLFQRNYWEMTPIQIRVKLADKFVGALKQQIAHDNLSKEKLVTLRAYTADKDICASECFASFILSLAQNKNEDVIRALVDVLDSERFVATWKAFSCDERSNICSVLLKALFQCQGPVGKTRFREKVVHVLEAEKKICETSALRSDQKMQSVLVGCAIKLLQNVNIKYILDAFVDIDTSSQIMQSCYSSLLRDAVKRSGTSTSGDASLIKQLLHLLDVNGKGNQKDFRSVEFKGARWELLEYLLELAEMPANQNDQNDVEAVLKTMMQMKDVWFVFLRILKPTSKLHSHAKVKIVVWALNSLRALILAHNMRVGYLLDLNETDVTTLATFCSLIDESERKPSEESSESTWKEKISTVWKKAHNFQEKFSKVERSIQFVQKVVKGVAEMKDAPELTKEINKRKKFSEKSINEVLDESYWGSLLLPLVDSAETLGRLRHSVFFYNIARAFLTAENGGVMGNAESDSADHVMQLLSSKGIERLQKACNPLFDRKNDPAIEEVHILLNGITNADDLHKELQFISKYFQRSAVPKAKEKMLANYLKYPLVQKKVQQLVPALEVFGYDNTNCLMIKNSLEEFAIPMHMKQMTLKGLCDSLETETMIKVDSNLDKDLTDVVSILAESRELLSFIEETVSEDMVVLIDVVEEHSDQFVSEATVSHLIDVHRFLKNIVKDKPTDPMAFLHRLKNCYDNLEGKQGMAAKIDECSRNVHSFRALYTNVANRGEMTKEIISNALRGGSYQLGQNDDGSWDVLLAYKRKTNQNAGAGGGKKGSKNSDQDTCYRLSDLQDLRSRALLIVNIDSKHHDGETRSNVHTECSAADLNEFVKQVDQIMEILSIAAVLHNTGHPDYKKFWVKLDSTRKIEEEARTLAQKLQRWKDLLENMQKKYFFLNFFHPDQLWILNDFFTRTPTFVGKETSRKSVIHDLLRFIQPSLPIEALDKLSSFYQNPNKRKTMEGDLCAIGEALNAFFLPLRAPGISKVPLHCLQGAVQPGELFVAVLERGSTQTVHVVMSLFELTTGAYPEPSQVLFCNPGTSWEEIRRLLRRSFEAQRHSRGTTLHCVANVESLPNDMQFDLVAAIKDFQSVANASYLLSLVCRGGPHHHIADQFSSVAHNVTGMTDVKLRAKFKEALPQVFVVTSELPEWEKRKLSLPRQSKEGNRL
ncbi:hypothetical protein OS493_004602 [Desmophyllum pertusum]|uniref:Uncharacterized protein n=1 Tax=Desmophyllum pertusum TaxID=174260 RepID=A0A9W9ZG23_9CNID|nr:hypothetical protein OS493_004602 [Desmophyllum pertusum]